MLKRKHVDYFDFLRIISIVGVIYMHIAASLLRQEINLGWHAMNLITCFTFTAVPLFFMMSGYLILSDKKTLDINVLLKKRLPRLVIPLISWTIVAILWQMISSDNLSLSFFLKSLVESLNKPYQIHLWYIYTLTALYIISPILAGGIKSLDKKGHIFVVTLITLISLRSILNIFVGNPYNKILDIDLINNISFLGGHLATFILGYYLGNLKKKIPNKVLIFLLLIVLLIITFGTYFLTIKDGAYNQTFQNQSSGFEIILASCIFTLFKQIKIKKNNFLIKSGIIPLIFGIYLMHITLLYMMVYIFPINTFVDTIYLTILNFVVCFITIKTLATIKPLCFIFTGIKYEDACKNCNWIYTYRYLRDKKYKINLKI